MKSIDLGCAHDSASAVPDSNGDTHSSMRAWASVGLLTLVGTLNLADRFLPGILTEPIKQDLHLTDTAIGLINGVGFLIVYAIMGIPIARIADRGAYGLVISGCVAAWSLMTSLGGLAQNGWQLALTRMGVAVGESGSTPAAHAYISRNFAPDKRALPLSVLTLSIPFAGTFGLMVGGLLGQSFGWRSAFLIMGAFGLAFVPLILVVLGLRQPVGSQHESVRVRTKDEARAGILRLLRKRSYQAILLASAFIAVAGYAHNTFAPAFLVRAHGLSVGEVGVQYGIATGVAGAIGALITGRVADFLSRRDARWLLWCVIIMIMILLPFTTAGYLVVDQTLAIWLLSLSMIISTAWMAPVIAAVQRLTPMEDRATASAVLLFVSAILGSLGPVATGALSDAMQDTYGPWSLGYALLLVPCMHVLAIAVYWLASLRFTNEITQAD